MGKFVTRHRLGVAASGAVVMALVMGLSLATLGMVRAREAEPRAEREATAARQVSEFLVELFRVSSPSEAPVHMGLGLYEEAGPLLQEATSVRREAWEEDGSLETAELVPSAVAEWKSGLTLTAKVTTTYEDLTEEFEPSAGAIVPVGEYTFTVGSLQYESSTGALVRNNATVQYGGYYDGRRASASITTTWSASRHLEGQGRYRVEDVRFSDRDQGFRAHLVRLRLEPRVNAAWSGAALLQYNSASNAFLVNARLRWNPREGTDLYLVWNEGLVTDRRSFDPVRPFSDQRTLMVKYSRTFTLGF